MIRSCVRINKAHRQTINMRTNRLVPVLYVVILFSALIFLLGGSIREATNVSPITMVTQLTSTSSPWVLEYLTGWPPLPEQAYRVSGTVLSRDVHGVGKHAWPNTILVFDYQPVTGAMGVALDFIKDIEEKKKRCRLKGARSEAWEIGEIFVSAVAIDSPLQCGGPISSQGMELILVADALHIPATLDRSLDVKRIDSSQIAVVAFGIGGNRTENQLGVNGVTRGMQLLVDVWKRADFKPRGTMFLGNLLWTHGEIEQIVVENGWSVRDPQPSLVATHLHSPPKKLDVIQINSTVVWFLLSNTVMWVIDVQQRELRHPVERRKKECGEPINVLVSCIGNRLKYHKAHTV